MPGRAIWVLPPATSMHIPAFLNPPSVRGPHMMFKSATMKEDFIKEMGRGEFHP